MLPSYQGSISVCYLEGSISQKGENLYVFIISDSCCLWNLNVCL